MSSVAGLVQRKSGRILPLDKSEEIRRGRNVRIVGCPFVNQYPIGFRHARGLGLARAFDV